MKTEKARERYRNLSKEEKENDNMVVNVTKISQKIKKINWLSMKKILQNEKKTRFIIIRNYYFKK